MSQDLTSINSAVPAHIAAAFGAPANTDLAGGVSAGYPIVSYKGKVWAVTRAGERGIITMDDSDDPAPSIRAIILRANPNLNKVYYPDGYEEGSSEKPTCHSNDSITPALDAVDKQSPKCAICPHNQWGSKITENGARGKACADSRRLAIAPESDIEDPMLLRVPAASLKTLMAFGENLTKRGVPYQALVTKIGFDHTVAYPSLTFKAERWLDADEVAAVKAMYDSDLVATITAINTPAAAEEAPETTDDFLPPGGPPAAAAQKAPPKARAKPAEVAAALAPEPAPVAAAEPAKKASGFGGKAKAAAAPVAAVAPAAEPASQTTVLMEGAMAELDSVLEGVFDDEPAEG